MQNWLFGAADCQGIDLVVLIADKNAVQPFLPTPISGGKHFGISAGALIIHISLVTDADRAGQHDIRRDGGAEAGGVLIANDHDLGVVLRIDQYSIYNGRCRPAGEQAGQQRSQACPHIPLLHRAASAPRPQMAPALVVATHVSRNARNAGLAVVER